MSFQAFSKHVVQKVSSLGSVTNPIFYCKIATHRELAQTKSHLDNKENDSQRTRNVGQPQVKPFCEIPGPLSLPVIGTLYLYYLGVYDHQRPHINGLKMYEKYGSLVKEEVMPGVQFVHVYDPSDIEAVFRSESHLPERRSHLALEKFRKERCHMYNTGGLLPTNGEDWWRLRKEFQKGLSAPQCVRTYLPATDDVIKKFVSNFLDRHIEDVLPLLSRLFLELTCLVAFDTSLNSFSDKEMMDGSRSSRLIAAAFNANSTIVKLDYTVDNWKNEKTFDYKFFEKSMLYMEEVAFELVKQKAELLSQGTYPNSADDSHRIPSLLEQYLSSQSLDFKDVLGMAVDLLLAGIDTTTYTACFALYHIARNERVQKLLREESELLLGPQGSNDSQLTADKLAHAPYARAVLKEVFRLNPISIGVGRNASKDMVLSGYHIPKGTSLVTQNQVSCKLEKYFKSPLSFVPERWLKGHPMQTSGSPYLSLPFGHGPRSCIARRLAEQHLLTFLLRVVHKHTIHLNGNYHLDCKFSGIINMPDRPVAISFSSH